MNNPLTERKRIVSWWIRWNDLNWPNGDNLDKIKRRAEKIAKANITTAMVFGTHFRWDYLPYFTLLHDYLGTVAEELGKCGVELWDHHSVNLIHRYDTKEQMRHVMLHSGPHLPFSPSREAAASWEYKGKRLNDWRMVDVKTRDVLYFPQYSAEGFCIRNPEFVDAYTDYVKKLISETGITGLSADDPVHYLNFNSCACPYCRAAFKERTGYDLPTIDEGGFFGNWANPAWSEWIDLRFDAAKNFVKRVSEVIPEGFRLTTCGANSASSWGNGMASDARTFLAGCNYVNLEMSGNTPPYKNDPVTVNVKIQERLTSSSHHQAVAREKGLNCFSTGFGFTEASANIVWAVNKMLGSDCWFSTLKDRLGLPDHILNTLPEEWDIVGGAFTFEKEHPELFTGDQVASLGVYFSYETRKHTFFGGSPNGYYKDFSKTLSSLFESGISPHTVFDFPTSTEKYPLILVPSPLKMTDKEKSGLNEYLKCGGVVIVYGPADVDGCESERVMPTSPLIDSPESFFCSVKNGVWVAAPDWSSKEFDVLEGDTEWREVKQGLYYTPHRICEGNTVQMLLDLTRQHIRKMPVEVTEAEGYLITLFETNDKYIIHMLSEDFDTDIDHELDEMRYHRSRVNFINRVEPVGITKTIRFKSDTPPEVYTPFNQGAQDISVSSGICTVTMKEKSSYCIFTFKK